MTNRNTQAPARTANGKQRARGLGLDFPGVVGSHNAITDVAGVEVGYSTLVRGEGPLIVGQGPVRTGVTAILPRGRHGAHIPCAAACHTLNGNGEMSGLAWIEEAGELQSPITITNTHSCGVTRDATIRWMIERNMARGQGWQLPVAAETYDGELNDINGFHVGIQHTYEALDGASGGPLALGNVGGGTGMITYDFKGGTGSASRQIVIEGRGYTVGVLVQSNFGQRTDLMVLGVPVGQYLRESQLRGKDQGSIIAIVATDAPLQPHQLKRLARRVPLGLARTGTIGGNGSGDIFLAFSTANAEAFDGSGLIRSALFLGLGAMDTLFRAVVEATEEAVIDAMITGETMTGRDGNTAIAIPHEKLLDILRLHGRA
jgi:L-aminopeptidase/D-esterase-like protein